MTAKRFTHKEDDWEILDNGEHLAYAHSGYQADKICELLNELHEENEQLRKDSTVLILANQDYMKENEQLKHRLAISNKASLVTALEKENEQLRKENSELKEFYEKYSPAWETVKIVEKELEE